MEYLHFNALFTCFLLVFCVLVYYNVSMLDLKKDIPVRQECFDVVEDKIAQIRDLLLEAEQTLHMAVETKDCLLTKEEVAEYFRCSPNAIPRAIPRFRQSGSSLFLKSDVDAYVNKRLKRNK